MQFKSSDASLRDPRDRLVREKYFSLRPKPLERFLWAKGLPQAAERVFWLHWEEGMKGGDWCSQLPIRRVASMCCIDTSTVTRAYQVLKTLGLIRREDPGRDPGNPFQQATAVTEVRVPRELLTELSRSPNRPVSTAVRATPVRSVPRAAPASDPVPPAAMAVARCLTRHEMQALWGRVSAAERLRFFEASRCAREHMDFDAPSALSAEDQAQLLAQLAQLARARTERPKGAVRPGVASSTYAPRRRLSDLELARTRKKLTEAVPAQEVADVLGQVTWAVEEGALRRFEAPLAINIALKKIREGAWTRPARMPPSWQRQALCPRKRMGASTETCTAA